MIGALWAKNKQVIFYGIALAVLLLLLKWLELNFLIMQHAFELYAGAIALLFTGLGVWLAMKLIKPKIQTVVIEKPVLIGANFELNTGLLTELHISERELEVLQLMAQGLSNQQIGDRLFVSLNTIKTHSANLFAKLDVQRRTQAVEKAKRLSLIP